MRIDLMTTKSEPNRLKKTVTTVASVNGTLRYPSSMMGFVATLEGIERRNANYCYVPDFNRYYFIEDVTIESNKIFTITCKVDVLMTYADDIKKLDVIVARNEKKWNLYLDDGTLKVYNKPLKNQLKFPTGFSSHEFILLVAGGAGLPESGASAHSPAAIGTGTENVETAQNGTGTGKLETAENPAETTVEEIINDNPPSNGGHSDG